jgi:hypothetical protein
MKNDRREFIKKTSALAALSIAGAGSGIIDIAESKGKQSRGGLKGKKMGSLYAAGYIRGLIEAIAKNG